MNKALFFLMLVPFCTWAADGAGEADDLPPGLPIVQATRVLVSVVFRGHIASGTREISGIVKRVTYYCQHCGQNSFARVFKPEVQTYSVTPTEARDVELGQRELELLLPYPDCELYPGCIATDGNNDENPVGILEEMAEGQSADSSPASTISSGRGTPTLHPLNPMKSIGMPRPFSST